MDAGGLRGGLGAGLLCLALLQRVRCRRGRIDRRRSSTGDPSHPDRPAGGPWSKAARERLRHGLPDGGWDVHTRLYPRRGPGGGPSAGDRNDQAGRSDGPQRGHRPGTQRSRDRGGGPPGDGADHSREGGTSTSGRPAQSHCRRHTDSNAAGLASPVDEHRKSHRLRLEMASVTPGRF